MRGVIIEWWILGSLLQTVLTQPNAGSPINFNQEGSLYVWVSIGCVLGITLLICAVCYCKRIKERRQIKMMIGRMRLGKTDLVVGFSRVCVIRYWISSKSNGELRDASVDKMILDIKPPDEKVFLPYNWHQLTNMEQLTTLMKTQEAVGICFSLLNREEFEQAVDVWNLLKEMMEAEREESQNTERLCHFFLVGLHSIERERSIFHKTLREEAKQNPYYIDNFGILSVLPESILSIIFYYSDPPKLFSVSRWVYYVSYQVFCSSPPTQVQVFSQLEEPWTEEVVLPKFYRFNQDSIVDDQEISQLGLPYIDSDGHTAGMFWDLVNQIKAVPDPEELNDTNENNTEIKVISLDNPTPRDLN